MQFNLVVSPLPGLASGPVAPARCAALGAVYPCPAMQDFPGDCLAEAKALRSAQCSAARNGRSGPLRISLQRRIAIARNYGRAD